MLKKINLDTKRNDALLICTFSLFIIILLWIIVFKLNRPEVIESKYYFEKIPLFDRIGKNIIPGRSIVQAYKNGGLRATYDHSLNLLAFLPFGILLPFFIKKRPYLYSSLIIVVATLLFEIEQLITGIGGFDASDLMTNALGGFIGLILYRYLFSRLSNRTINWISIVINIVAFPFAMYAIVNTILHFDLYL